MNLRKIEYSAPLVLFKKREKKGEALGLRINSYLSTRYNETIERSK